MSAVTFESVLSQAERLSPLEKAQLISVLAHGLAQLAETSATMLSPDEHLGRGEAFRGKYYGSLASVDEFLPAKPEENEAG